MITILLADDHALVREGLRTVLEKQYEWSVVGDVGDGRACVDLALKLQPDVVIVDLMLPGINGMEVIHQLKKRLSRTHYVAISMHDDEPYVLAALRNGAEAYVLKEASSTEIVQAVREVLAGRRYLSPPLSESMLDTYAIKAKGEPFDPFEALTPREREVLYLAALGKTSAAIAEELKLSPRTVEVHRTNLMRKLGLHNQGELIHFALARGLIPLQP
jgi:two-component system response regulator NreC